MAEPALSRIAEQVERDLAANGWFARRGRATNAELGEAVRGPAVERASAVPKSGRVKPGGDPTTRPPRPRTRPRPQGRAQPGPGALRANRVARRLVGPSYLVACTRVAPVTVIGSASKSMKIERPS
jgi:hypothetical protein